MFGRNTNLNRGNFEYSDVGVAGRASAAKASMIVLNLWMEVVRLLEDAVYHCGRNETDAATMSWDSAFGLYSGSLVHAYPMVESTGKFLYHMAESNCRRMKTCGSWNNETTGTSYISLYFFDGLRQGQTQLSSGQCTDVSNTKYQLKKILTTLLVQNWLVSIRELSLTTNNNNNNEDDKDIAWAETTAYSASVLPLLYDCNIHDAVHLHSLLRFKDDHIDYGYIKFTVEKYYPCINVTCAMVGGAYNAGANAYYEYAEPCKDNNSNNNNNNNHASVTATPSAVPAVLKPRGSPLNPKPSMEIPVANEENNNAGNNHHHHHDDDTWDEESPKIIRQNEHAIKVLIIMVGALWVALLIACVLLIQRPHNPTPQLFWQPREERQFT